MRKLQFCFVLGACIWIFAPAIRAGGQKPASNAGQQWRIFPNSPFRRAAEGEITSRFTRQIEPLVLFFQPDSGRGDYETIAESLLDEKARAQFFRLESLLRLYVRALPDLRKYLGSVKQIEDGIGAYSYAVDSLKYARTQFELERTSNASRVAEQQKILAALQKKQAKARATFNELVDESTVASDLIELRSQLGSSLAGWPASKDLAYVNGELVGTLKAARDRRYDFNKLEDGIHEFRRQLRWFPMMIDSLDGLILLRDDPPGACPVPELESLAGSRAAKHRYSNPALSFPASHPCTISRCLLWPVVKTIDEIGAVKDAGEGNAALQAALDFDDDHVAWTNKLAPAEIAHAREIRTQLLSSHALDSLIGQLSSCKP